MRIATTILITFYILGASAQITITDADLPDAGDIATVSIGNPQDVTAPELTGTNYTWDFSNLTPVAQRTDTFTDVTQTPLGYQLFFNNQFSYPDHVADYGIPGAADNLSSQINFEDVYNYFRKESDAYIQVGFGAKISGIPTSVRYQPTDTIYSLPLNYNDTDSNNYAFEITIPSFGHYGQTATRTDTVDGWGTVITPYGTFNALRIKSTIQSVDTTYIDALSFGTTFNRPEQIEYKWLALGEDVPVLLITTNGSQVSRVEYKDNFLGLNVSTNDIHNPSVYPNPAQEFVTITNASGAQLRVFGSDGKIIRQERISGDRHNINMRDVAPGVYMLSLLLGEQHITKRIIIE